MTARPDARPETRLFLGFAMVGVLGFATDAGLLAAGTAAGLTFALARAISVTTALHVTFLSNGCLVFRSLSRRTFARQWAGYMLANGFGAACNYAVFVALTTARLPLVSAKWPAFVAAAVVGLVVNYTGSRLLAFRQTQGVAGGAPGSAP